MGVLRTMDSSNTASKPCRASRVETDHFGGGLSRNKDMAQRPRMWPQVDIRRQELGQTMPSAERSGVQPPREQDLIEYGRQDLALGHPVWLWIGSHVAAYRLSHSCSPIGGSSTPQSLPDCLFLARVQGSLASCQPGKEDFGRFGHEFPRQVTGQASESSHICLTHLKSIDALHTQHCQCLRGTTEPPLCSVSTSSPWYHSRPGISEPPSAASGAPEISVGVHLHRL